jgi:hypothetical protein
VHAAKALGTHIVILGTSLTPASELKVPLETYVSRLAEELPRRCELWIGGHAVLDSTKIRYIGTLELLDRMLQKTP